MRLALGLTVIGWMCLPATPQGFDAGTGNTILWGAGAWAGTDEPVTRMESGDFTADQYQDLVLQEGSDLVLAFGAGIFQARSHLVSGVVDFCAVPTNSGVDALLASTASGLMRIKINYGAAGHVQLNTFQSQTWGGARNLRTLVSGNQPPKVVALDTTRSKILVLSNPASGVPATWEIDLDHSPGLALAVIDWEGNGVVEVAVMHATGLDIY